MANFDNYNDLCRRIYDIISVHCRFAEAVIQTHCKHIQRTPQNLTREDLTALAPKIGYAVGMFTNPVKGKEVEDSILLLRSS
jgi:hypothetical protein